MSNKNCPLIPIPTKIRIIIIDILVFIVIIRRIIEKRRKVSIIVIKQLLYLLKVLMNNSMKAATVTLYYVYWLNRLWNASYFMEWMQLLTFFCKNSATYRFALGSCNHLYYRPYVSPKCLNLDNRLLSLSVANVLVIYIQY